MNKSFALAMLTTVTMSLSSVALAEDATAPANAGGSCGTKKEIKPINKDICDVLIKPEDIDPNNLPYSMQNPFLGGCDFSAFSFPGLPDFGFNITKDTLCNIAEGLVNPFIDGLNDTMQAQTDLVIDKVTMGYGTKIDIGLTQENLENGNILGGGGGESVYNGTLGGSSGGSVDFVDTVSDIKNLIKAANKVNEAVK